jgi:hypothetical protein
MAQKPEVQALADAIIDEQLDAETLIERSSEAGPSIAARITHVARELFTRYQAGRITFGRMRELRTQAYVALVLGEHVKHLEAVKDHVDQHHDAQLAEAKRSGKPLRELAPIRKADLAARKKQREEKKT